jgi:peroxiredoxin
MQIESKNFQWLSIALLIFGAAWISLSAPEPEQFNQAQSAPSKGFLAPDFTLTTLTGETIALSDLRGEAVLINLWASWCGPCRAEMPAMQEIHERYSDRGFHILAVNATNQDSLESAAAFVDELGVTYPILLDLDGNVSALYQLRALPSTFFVGPDGRITEVIVGGPMAEALLSIRAEELLAELP